MGARLGQHFLKREDIAGRIVAAAELKPGDAVVEIGPGGGILTKGLLASGAEVTAVEYDERLHDALAERLSANLAAGAGKGDDLSVNEPRLRLLRADFLEMDLAALPSPCRIAANLPYSVASPILQRILAWPHWDRAVLMFQKEVAERIVAGPGSRKYGILSVSVMLHAKARIVCDVSRECFAPRPAVDSAVVRLDRREVPLPERVTEERLMKVVKAAFGQRRKQAANALAHRLELPRAEVEKALAAAGIQPLERAENIGLDAFIKMARHLPF